MLHGVHFFSFGSLSHYFGNSLISFQTDPLSHSKEAITRHSLAIYIVPQNRHVYGLSRRRRKAVRRLMTYPTYLSLKLVTIIIGLLAVISHLPPALAPGRFGAFMKTL